MMSLRIRTGARNIRKFTSSYSTSPVLRFNTRGQLHSPLTLTTLRYRPIQPLSYSRAMSTAATPKHKFFVYAPDFTDEGCLQRRLSVRDQHLAGAKALGEKGIIISGGALLSPESIATPDAQKKMVGSTITLLADSLEDARKIIESDIYYTSKVWDPEGLVILPLLTANVH